MRNSKELVSDVVPVVTQIQQAIEQLKAAPYVSRVFDVTVGARWGARRDCSRVTRLTVRELIAITDPRFFLGAAVGAQARHTLLSILRDLIAEASVQPGVDQAGQGASQSACSDLIARLAVYATRPEFPEVFERPLDYYCEPECEISPELASLKIREYLRNGFAERVASGEISAQSATLVLAALRACADDLEGAYSQSTNFVESDNDSLHEFYHTLDRLYRSSSPYAPLARGMLRKLHEAQFSVLLLYREHSLKQTGELLGVSESRVSQVLTQVRKKISSVLSAEMPSLYSAWNERLNQPAADEEALLTSAGEIEADLLESTIDVVRYTLELIGAKNPFYQEARVRGLWCFDDCAFQRVANELTQNVSHTRAEYEALLRARLPSCAPGRLIELFKDSLFYLRRYDRFFDSQREAAIWLLAQTPTVTMSSAQIAAALELPNDRIKHLLRSDPRVIKEGKNSARRYSVPAAAAETGLRAGGETH